MDASSSTSAGVAPRWVLLDVNYRANDDEDDVQVFDLTGGHARHRDYGVGGRRSPLVSAVAT
jgi:hypothetical protein